MKSHEKPQLRRASPTKHQSEYRSLQAGVDRANDTEDCTATYYPQEEVRISEAPAPAPEQQPGLDAPSPTVLRPAPEKAPETPARLPPSLYRPGLPERVSSAKRWAEEGDEEE